MIHNVDDYHVITWKAIPATKEEIAKRMKKKYPNLEAVNILYAIENTNAIIKNQETDDIQFVIQTNKMTLYNNLTKVIIDKLKTFPKCLRQNNSRGIGLEFGYYSFAGPDNKNGANMKNGVCKPLLRKPTHNSSTKQFQVDTLIPIVTDMWKHLIELFPIHAQQALNCTPTEFRYPSNTGFSKVTVAHNNGTPYHYDKNNLHDSMAAIFIMCGDETVHGGEQIIEYNGDAVIIKATHGLLIIGDYTRMNHAVFPILQGDRIAIIAYSMEKVYKYSR